MTLKIAFQMEPLLNPEDFPNTYLLMQEAAKRGYHLYHYLPTQIAWLDGKVMANLSRVHLESGIKVAVAEWQDLSEMNVVMVRQDPPFNMEYITATYLLERLDKKTLVVNDPYWLRNSPEKLLPVLFPKFMPPTLIAQDADAIRSFAQEHKEVVVKPLYGYHGFGVFLFKDTDPNLEAWLEQQRIKNETAFVVQKFIPEVKTGNKRVVLFDGEAVGSLITIPPDEEFRIFRNSKDLAYKLNVHDKEICDAVGPELKKRGLIFAGMDIIGDYLIEVNVTSVGSLKRLNTIYGGAFEAKLWDRIEGKMSGS